MEAFDPESWQCMAVVETEQGSGLAPLIEANPTGVLLRSAPQSPSGFDWYEFWVYRHDGDTDAARQACNGLRTLLRIAEEQHLTSVRIVQGNEWLNFNG